ncbi:helix-turn-helix domain-containing protein [Ferrimonas marina]|uniref:DNA-binding transcriptional regulator, XRE-family HTH domain n=1 Tax=Ferrimonas marina TaxID=299255 RepID=A0A1M5X7M7_9GAMM|nr:helix-turn-helix transcriptional regulator [Ferrimonas marina]SHH95835.1 DNA-binding transcriptional regulator, XRE-family HTH domain [Ferrimonas marina]
MKSNVCHEFGARIKQLRQAKGLSQEQLADIAELDRTYISGIERGIRNVGLVNIDKLANALQITLAELFRFERMQP